MYLTRCVLQIIRRLARHHAFDVAAAAGVPPGVPPGHPQRWPGGGPGCAQCFHGESVQQLGPRQRAGGHASHLHRCRMHDDKLTASTFHAAAGPAARHAATLAAPGPAGLLHRQQLLRGRRGTAGPQRQRLGGQRGPGRPLPHLR